MFKEWLVLERIMTSEFVLYCILQLGLGTIPLVVFCVRMPGFDAWRSLGKVIVLQIFSLASFYLTSIALWYIEGPNAYKQFFFHDSLITVPACSLAACTLFNCRNKKSFLGFLVLNSLICSTGLMYMGDMADRPKPHDPFAPRRVDRTRLLERAI